VNAFTAAIDRLSRVGQSRRRRQSTANLPRVAGDICAPSLLCVPSNIRARSHIQSEWDRPTTAAGRARNERQASREVRTAPSHLRPATARTDAPIRAHFWKRQ
jgi:hypothetical protein